MRRSLIKNAGCLITQNCRVFIRLFLLLLLHFCVSLPMLKVDCLPLLNKLGRLGITLILVRKRYILQIVLSRQDRTALSKLYKIIKLLPYMRQATENFLELVTRFRRIVNRKD